MSNPSGTVRVRLFAAAADAVGQDELTLGDIPTAGRMIDAICEGREERVRLVLDQCSLLVDGDRVTGPETPLESGATVDVLPPFAGG
ncbi:MAG: MoaD/ThiS family protein [Solirubrobacterales bacterium]|nr:MoaD/ThiS family protein [Solirubrobacterales bacterium]